MTVKASVRDSSIDVLKCIAIIGVVVIHACSKTLYYPIGSTSWYSGVFLASIVRGSVPLFLMCSGALLLDPNRELSVRKLFTKNLLRILIALFFWAFLYIFADLYVSRSLTVQGLLEGIKKVLTFQHEFHLYYLHITLLIYVFLPVTRLFVKHANNSTLLYAIGLWFVLGILYPTVKPYWPFTLLKGIPLQWLMNMTYASIGYGLLGYALKKFAALPPPQEKFGMSWVRVQPCLAFS